MVLGGSGFLMGKVPLYIEARVPMAWEGRYKATWKSGIQTPMAQGRSTASISMVKWTRTSRLSIEISLSTDGERRGSNLKDFEASHVNNGSSQGQNLAYLISHNLFIN